MYVFQHGIIASAIGGGGLDPSASDFITVANITDSTQQDAINQLVLDLKSYSIWSKLEAIYPYIGGNATSHSYNLKDTTQFQITWNGGVTHDSNGITGNGTNGYGNTGLIPNSVLTNFVSMGVYIGNNVLELKADIGSYGTSGCRIISRYSSNIFGSLVMDGTNKTVSGVTDSRGLKCINRTTTSNRQAYLDGVEYLDTNTSSGYSTFPVSVLAINNNGTNSLFSTRQQRFAFIGNSLTTTEHANLYTAIQDFQTALIRNV